MICGLMEYLEGSLFRISSVNVSCRPFDPNMMLGENKMLTFLTQHDTLHSDSGVTSNEFEIIDRAFEGRI